MILPSQQKENVETFRKTERNTGRPLYDSQERTLYTLTASTWHTAHAEGVKAERERVRALVEGMKEEEHKKEWWCEVENRKEDDYFSHNDNQYCPRDGKKMKLREYDRFAFSSMNEDLDTVLAALDSGSKTV